MNLLAIDTSTEFLSLAVMNGEKLISRFHRKAARSHSRLLVPMIDKLLKKARLKLKDIDVFCISIGPGSFTGLRIGVATVKGLAYSLKRPIVSLPTLDAIAQNAKGFRGIICPVLDAKKNKVYACLYKSDGKDVRRISKYLLLPAADLMKIIGEIEIKNGKILFLGDAVGQIFRVTAERHTAGGGYPKKFIVKDWHPKAEFVARLGLEYFKKRRFTSPEDLEPLYLYSRECDIKGI